MSLWLVPPRLDAKKLKSVMTFHDTDTQSGSFPKFEPHITLASIPADIPISTIRECIHWAQNPPDVTFRSIEIGNHYFRSVYIAVDLSPELTALHQKIYGVLGIDPDTPAFPHVSLCYVTDEDAKNGLRIKFFEALRIRKDGDGVALRSGGCVDSEEWIGGFKANEVWITKCEGRVESWEILDIIKLGDSRKDRGESLEVAAVRETFEETGYQCELLPCRMPTHDAVEAFAMSMRPLKGNVVKFISWYLTKLKAGSEGKVDGIQTPWENYESAFIEANAAVERLDFPDDVQVAQKAIRLVKEAIIVDAVDL
ncbi:hypothetical protein AX15_006352 [Amanita polypyramis BW_CC]|nr:hypothetical protein AX15_006352 [Amanita polypyramis BW_CC]